ncbi:reticulophagy regulator 3 isoform X4 [Dermacentor albipictus]|uniref:reticulophagy regulator 3 isoform X4 n=1 Tax=Dermacentor albipictus TaxID=60249 RepID=UPI0038FC2843
MQRLARVSACPEAGGANGCLFHSLTAHAFTRTRPTCTALHWTAVSRNKSGRAKDTWCPCVNTGHCTCVSTATYSEREAGDVAMNMNIDRMRFCVGGSVFAHGLYWVLRLVVSCSRRFYSFVALIAAVVFMYKTWVNSIWPEIRVPPPEGEDNEQWTPVHPQVFSVPELSRYITDWSESVRKWVANVILLRKTNPGLFCILASSTFAMTAVLGRMVSGVLILYSLLMAVTLGPGIALYVIPATWYEQADALMRIASGKPPRRKQRNEEIQFYEGMGSLPDYDEDTDLDSFLPDMTTMPSLSEVCDSEEQFLPSAATASSASMHFSTSHFKMDSSDSEGDDTLIRGLTSTRRPARQPEASKSRPLAVGPRTSRHSSQGSDIDIDEYEVVDKRELPHL